VQFSRNFSPNISTTRILIFNFYSYFHPENQLKMIFFYSFGFQPEQGIRPGLLPIFFSPSGPTGHLSIGALQVYVSHFRKYKESKAAFAFFFPEQLQPPPPHD
jgi:hypothetical protein